MALRSLRCVSNKRPVISRKLSLTVHSWKPTPKMSKEKQIPDRNAHRKTNACRRVVRNKFQQDRHKREVSHTCRICNRACIALKNRTNINSNKQIKTQQAQTNVAINAGESRSARASSRRIHTRAVYCVTSSQTNGCNWMSEQVSESKRKETNEWYNSIQGRSCRCWEQHSHRDHKAGCKSLNIKQMKIDAVTLKERK